VLGGEFLLGGDSPQTGLPPQSVAQAEGLKARHVARFTLMPGPLLFH